MNTHKQLIFVPKLTDYIHFYTESGSQAWSCLDLIKDNLLSVSLVLEKNFVATLANLNATELIFIVVNDQGTKKSSHLVKMYVSSVLSWTSLSSSSPTYL